MIYYNVYDKTCASVNVKCQTFGLNPACSKCNLNKLVAETTQISHSKRRNKICTQMQIL